MKKVSIVVCLLAVLLLVSSAHAALELRGTDSQGNRLIYDTDFNITWYDYSKSVAEWQSQMNWASALSVSGGDLVGVYDDWQLPSAVDGLGVNGYDGTTTTGDNITSSEMGHLYYTELGNKGYCSTSGVCPQAGYGLINKGDFQNLQLGFYWSGTESAAVTVSAFAFYTGYGNGGWQGNGNQAIDNKESNYYAIAVRPGDVAVVPEPISSILFITGAGFLAGRRLLKRR